MFFDSSWFLFAIPPLLLGLWAQHRMRSAFGKYSKVRSARNMTGAEAARALLDANGLEHVAVERIKGTLTDHYDPRSKTLRLSDSVFGTPSLAAVGVAAHEAGHALQDRDNYGPLRLRGAMVPAVNIGTMLGPILFFIGFLLSGASAVLGTSLLWLGIALFGMAALFAIVTLPVEFNASARAKKVLATNEILTPEEIQGVDKVLDAAALTYVAAAAQAIGQLLYYVALMNRRR
ncbi:MAG: zinc metallopeptidase [Caldilineaceae bacterium]